MWYFTQVSEPMRIILDEDEEKVAAVPVTVVRGPFDTVDEMRDDLEARVRQANGNGTAFHVYHKPEEIPMVYATAGRAIRAKR